MIAGQDAFDGLDSSPRLFAGLFGELAPNGPVCCQDVCYAGCYVPRRIDFLFHGARLMAAPRLASCEGHEADRVEANVFSFEGFVEVVFGGDFGGDIHFRHVDFFMVAELSRDL